MAERVDRVVTVFGANDAQVGSEAYETARAVGRALAKLGCVVANGGYGGTMAASARGAREAGGRTIGVICSIWPSDANEYIDSVVVTDCHSARLNKLIELGTAGCVVLPGATGTLVELATVWELMSKGLLEPRPLICLGDFWQAVIDLMCSRRPQLKRWVTLVPSVDGLTAVLAAR